MPRSGYTSVTVPVQLRDRLKATSSELGFSSVPQMLDSWLWERTGTVQVRGGLDSPSQMTMRTGQSGISLGEQGGFSKNRVWCGRRDSNPGRLRGRQISGYNYSV